MIAVPLSRGFIATIDTADAELVGKHRWHLCPANQREDRYYAQTCIGGRTVRMHRLIMDPARGLEVDHIDGDGLNNRRANLRIATRSQNCANRAVENSTGFRGVAHQEGRFRAFISAPRGAGRKCIHLGYFSTPRDAALAYDKAAIVRWGQFARLNFPEAA